LELAQAKNDGESMIYAADKVLDDFKDKINEAQKKEIEGANAKVREAITSNDVARIRSATDELKKILEKIGGSFYQQGTGAGGTGGASGQGADGQGSEAGWSGNQPPPGSESGWEDTGAGR
jgi:molecular chaperone DnaK